MQFPKCSLSLVILATAFSFFSSSCTSTKVITDYDCADATNLIKDTTVWHYFWGLKQAKDIRPGCDPRYNHLNQVIVKTGPGHVILSFITLGIVIPQRLTWCCAPPNLRPGTIGAIPKN